ncbi:EnvZ/OmpR regulon moderator MzrA [Edwardsiella piscicida]|nr:EnvZ/OmpR regulon moderator MzrA [Edwardsiella piscicida]AKM48847.1 modulator protein [Edwardsiella sp. EA181011]UOU80830.1 EnvZ/OmpR regulon moderator MzrA [Edwardsiella anguillarum]WGS77499.1 EnvZ/OmpR regulon moderator MzrA [Edwardsiella piscicida]WGS80888.1 EnvZ/OmpR regulon moderator MzrA [Edwardsiella piscicida]WHP81991.1 EnvZ/OmpR regulon moderator MzrA [Edwardsiella anguillarum]
MLGLLLFIVAALTAVILPQLGHKEVSLQIRATHSGLATPDGFFVYQKLDENGVSITSITPDREGLVVRLARPEQQALALQVLQRELPPGYSIADKILHRSLFHKSERPAAALSYSAGRNS